MLKPGTLRDVLLQFVPSLKADPTKLSLFVDKGRIAATAGSLSFEYRYTLNLVAQDFAGDEDELIVPILAWIGQHQPDLLERADGIPFRFEAEVLEAGAADVSIWIELDEPVKVAPREGGGFDTMRPDQDAGGDAFDIGCTPLWQVLLGDEVAAQTNNPEFAG